MTIQHGRNCLIFIGGVDVTGDLNSVIPTSEQDLADVTTFGHVGHTFYPGLSKDSGTIEGIYNSSEASVFNNMIQTATSPGMMIAYGSALGNPVHTTNQVGLKSNSIKSVVTDVNRVSVSFDTENYPFEAGVMLTAGKQTIAAISTGDGTTVDNGSASGTTGGAAYLQVITINSTSGTLTVKVETSATGAFAGEEATTATFAVASTAGTERVAITSQITEYARASWIDAGSTCEIAVALVRY